MASLPDSLGQSIADKTTSPLVWSGGIRLIHDDFRVITAAFPAPSGPANAAFAGFMGQFVAMIIAPQYFKMI